VASLLDTASRLSASKPGDFILYPETNGVHMFHGTWTYGRRKTRIRVRGRPDELSLHRPMGKNRAPSLRHGAGRQPAVAAGHRKKPSPNEMRAGRGSIREDGMPTPRRNRVKPEAPGPSSNSPFQRRHHSVQDRKSVV